MVSGEFTGRALALGTALAVGTALLTGCGGDGERTPPAPVATGGEVREGDANRCELTLARSGANYVGHAVVNGTIPGGSELVYTARYKATWEDGSYSAPEKRTTAGGTMSAPAVIKVNGKDREFFGFRAKIDLAGKRINLTCGAVTLDDLK